MLNQKFILITLAAFILISFSFLAVSENRQHRLKDGWFLYFNDIQDQSLNFTIENYADNPNFVWELSSDGTLITQKNIQVLKGNKESVTITESPKGKQIKITVYLAKETKEIYKNFDK